MLLDSARQEIATLMAAFRSGDSSAGARLIEVFYPELKRIAAKHLQGERKDHSWQPTLLVNELYLELVRVKALPAKESERHNEKAAFFALAGQIMGRLLVHHARPIANKAQRVPLWKDLPQQGDTSVHEVENLLTRLSAIKPAIRSVVEMKVFEGLTAEEIAPKLGCSTVTVNRYWKFARHWLRKEWADETGGAEVES